MTGSVDIKAMTMEVTEVSAVLPTTIEQDEDGNYVREIRIMTQGVADTGALQTFVLRLKGATHAALQIEAPPSEF